MKFYTLEELSKNMGLSAGTLREWCKAGKFPNAMKHGHWLVPEGDVEALATGLDKAGEKVEERDTELIALEKETAKINAEAAKIAAQVSLDVAQGTRDKPEALAQKEQELIEREAVVVHRESVAQSVIAREERIADRVKAQQRDAAQIRNVAQKFQGILSELYEACAACVNADGQGARRISRKYDMAKAAETAYDKLTKMLDSVMPGEVIDQEEVENVTTITG